MKHKKIITVLLFFVFSTSLITGQNTSAPLKAQYNYPASDWESEAMPLGNGFIGGMVFGGVDIDIVRVNDHTVWSGGPGKNPNYNGGHRSTAEVNHQNLQKARNALQEEMITFSTTKEAYFSKNGMVMAQNYTDVSSTRNTINTLKGTKTDFGSYQVLSDINIAYSSVSFPEIVNIEGDCDNPSNLGEKFPSLFDNNTNTKWFADQGLKAFPCYIAWQYDTPFSTSSYAIISANDMPDRDPQAWTLYGSNDGENYTAIDTRENVTFSSRHQSIKFNLKKTEIYKYFKFEIAKTTGGAPPQLSEIALENASQAQFPEYTDYLRVLDIDNAVAMVNYTLEGVNYKREYFISNPDNVIVIRISADKAGSISRNIRITTPQSKIVMSAADGVITMTGSPSDQTANGLKFAQQVKVIPTGGVMTAQGTKINVENADQLLIISSTSTNYQQCMDDTYNYFTDVDPLTTVEKTVADAVAKTYDQLLKSHTDDYKSLYDKMSLSIADAENTNNKMTNQLLADYKSNKNTVAENRYLEQLYYQFGRYLLISSSRKNSLPANLQGIWSDGLSAPWSADYHTNINVQMNYWLAQQTNLVECHLPVIEFTKAQVPRGRLTAQHYYCKQDGSPVRGWVIHHECNIWGNSGPAESDAFYFPAAAGWMCQDIWEYYLFNQDKEFLEEHYPILLNAALFWVDNLWRDSRDGTLVASPSYSPEHGPYSLGASCDQAIIAELFDMVIKASEVLGKNTPEVKEVRVANSKLAGPRIGLGGQFMEWKDEIAMDISGDGGHRHVNHLFWLHPGSQIVAGRSAQDNLFAEAMKKTLNTRGDGGTGWSKGWKINFWARLRDGDRSHKLVQEILKESTLTNLFDTHPPFQIDGNFGSTAGMTEMLVQSQGGSLEVLPALPSSWNTGSFKGIKARGNFELNADWSEGKLTSLEILSNSGSECSLKYDGIKDYKVSKQGGGTVDTTVVDNNKVIFKTERGAVYVVNAK